LHTARLYQVLVVHLMILLLIDVSFVFGTGFFVHF
jgi:hypothetical protein